MFNLRRFDRSTSVFIGLLVISFLLATFDVRSQGTGASAGLREGTQALFGPLQRAAGFVLTPVVGLVDGISDLAGLREENELLKAQVRELERELADTATLRNQVAELEAINGLEPPEDLNAITARVVAASPSEFDFTRIIDIGTEDGVLRGMPVIDENGLVGRIIFVSDSFSQVRLVTDPSLTVGVRVKETNETGTVTGQGSGPLRVEMYGAKEPIEEGFRLVTAGSRFPPGIDVAVVTEASRSEASFTLTTRADPVIVVSKLDFVKVIVDWDPLELPEDIPEETDPGEAPPAVSEEEL